MVKPFLSGNAGFSTSFNNKSQLLDEMMQVLMYVLFYMSSTKSTIYRSLT